jgi:hypothetical protein
MHGSKKNIIHLCWVIKTYFTKVSAINLTGCAKKDEQEKFFQILIVCDANENFPVSAL